MMYLIWANIYLVFFYGFYWLFMRNETFFQLNRLYLIGSLIGAFLLPLLDVKGFLWAPQVELFPAALHFQAQVVVLGTVEQGQSSWLDFIGTWPPLVLVYLIGCLFFLGKLLYQGILIRRSLNTTPTGQAFSFFHIIHVDPELVDVEKVIEHEHVHVRQYHSLDIVLIEVVKIIIWFNPVIYLLCKSVKLTHEYIADELTAAQGKQRIYYAESLLNQAFQSPSHSLRSNFVHESFIKKRIIMLFKNKSKKSVLSRYLILIPMLLMVLAFQHKTPNPLEDKPADSIRIDQQEEKRAVPSVGWEAFLQGISSNFQYSKEARLAKVNGRMIVTFDVDEHGSIQDVKIVKDLGHGTAQEAIRVLQESAKWIPALVDGKAVRSSFTLPILLDYSAQAEVPRESNRDVPPPPPVPASSAPIAAKPNHPHVQQSSNPSEEKSIFEAVEVQPEPPGGMAAFLKYIGLTYNFPQEALEAEVSGRLVATFVVEPSGELSGINMLQDLGHGTGVEAIRVLTNSQKWKPGIQNGRAVRVQYTLPIILRGSKSSE